MRQLTSLDGMHEAGGSNPPGSIGIAACLSLSGLGHRPIAAWICLRPLGLDSAK